MSATRERVDVVMAWRGDSGADSFDSFGADKVLSSLSISRSICAAISGGKIVVGWSQSSAFEWYEVESSISCPRSVGFGVRFSGVDEGAARLVGDGIDVV